MERSTIVPEKRHGHIDPEVMGRLHASAVTDESKILALLEIVHRTNLMLVGRRTVRGDAESARLIRIESREIQLKCEHVAGKVGDDLLLSFSLEGRSYFFTASVVSSEGDLLRAAIPVVLYVAERRDRRRAAPSSGGPIPQRVELSALNASWASECLVQDFSPVGVYVESPEGEASRVGTQVRLRYLDGAPRGSERWGIIRHARPAERPGWMRLGVSTSQIPFSPPLTVERRRVVSSASPIARARNGLTFLSAGVAATSGRLLRRAGRGGASGTDIDLVSYSNGRGEKIAGILDRSDDRTGGTAIIIPPAWGRTKETLLPLAATLVQTFRRAGESVAVLRFDGTRRRGESYKDPGFEGPGLEHIPFRFAHAIEDILASSRFLTECPRVRASRVILVTFSAASIEGRRALVNDQAQTISGWVSVVGTPDLQSGMRTVSGGIDYVAGVEQGLSFGRQEIMGVTTDVDELIGNALELELAFLEDARRDMAAISVPITWIHGANDAWLDLERVREVMGAGVVSGRKLIEVPTGHQLRSSKEALEVFMLVAEECAGMALKRPLRGVLPRLVELDRRREAERARLSNAKHDIREFWRKYLLGREGMLGIELMNATHAYESLMTSQISGLHLIPGSVVADVGAGTGSFLLALLDMPGRPRNLVVDEIDYVPEAFDRARERLIGRDVSDISVSFVECDLEHAQSRDAVFGRARYDAVLLSLVLSYVQDPLALLKAIARGMRPGARLVASTLQRDADISRLYLESVDELRTGRARRAFGAEAEVLVDESVRTFLNDMARVLDLEEQGVFGFLDDRELVDLVRNAGFEGIRTCKAFGDPPQAVVVTAQKPGSSGL